MRNIAGIGLILIAVISPVSPQSVTILNFEFQSNSFHGVTVGFDDEYYHSSGVTAFSFDNTFYLSNGQTSEKYGDWIFDSDGTFKERIGNFWFDSDGSFTEIVGDAYFHSDDKMYVVTKDGALLDIDINYALDQQLDEESICDSTLYDAYISD